MIDAKPCHHSGYVMRSHAECVWARYMDVLGIEWLYEPTIWHTDAGAYLPDFLIPAADVFLEIKGAHPTPAEIDKAEALMRASGKLVVFGYEYSSFAVFDGRIQLMGGMMLAPSAKGWIKIPVNAVYGLLLGSLGEVTGYRLIEALKAKFVDDWLPSDRADLETYVMTKALPLNTEKSLRHRQVTMGEVLAGQAATWLLERQ